MNEKECSHQQGRTAERVSDVGHGPVDSPPDPERTAHEQSGVGVVAETLGPEDGLGKREQVTGVLRRHRRFESVGRALSGERDVPATTTIK